MYNGARANFCAIEDNIKPFQSNQELGDRINTLVFGFLTRHQGARPFMDAIIGPKFNYLSNFAIEKTENNPGTRSVLKEDIQPPHGLSIPITLAHAMMRGLPQKIAAHFQPYFDATGVSRDLGATLEADAAKLAKTYEGQTLTVTVDKRTARFKNGGEILKALFNLSAIGQYNVPRTEGGRNHLAKSVGGAKDAFDSLLRLTQQLREDFIPGTGPDEVQHFDDLRWDFNLSAVNNNFAKNAEYFHRARHYVFLTIDAKDSEILPLFYWKEARPQEHAPLSIETPEEAASCMLALGQKINKGQRGHNIHPLGNRLMDDAQRVADGRTTVASCLDAPTLAQLDTHFPDPLRTSCKWRSAIDGLKTYIQKEPPLETKAAGESPVRPDLRDWPPRSGAEEYTGR